ncbi:Zn-dependent alcohol dehydrogenase [Nocardioides sp. NPDC006303]|uniref:Zn-dependent alcohol dehydrogenase n=1 Tax=Nocardioides sp. NPDC006303 TaxID=3156747 RepID=UPI0033AD57B7
MRAAVLNRVGALDIETLHVDEPGPNEVRIRPHHVGLCHSDLHYIDGTHQTDLPEVLGHEAAGVVESIGENVSRVSVGDHVVTSLTMFCGTCMYCVTGRLSLCEERARLRQRPRPSLVNDAGEAVGVMGGVGAFAEMLVIHENGVARLDRELPLPVAALFGCAVLTGVGAVVRSADVRVGDTVAVIGCGGIGLAAVQGARLAGASRIIAIDLAEAKLRAAARFGATDILTSGSALQDELRKLVPNGVDFSFEAVGRRETVEAAMQALAPGGTCTVLGMVPDSTPIQVPASQLYFTEKRLQGAFIGSSRFVVDVAQLSALYGQRRLDLDGMISHRLAFDEIQRGFELLKHPDTLRVVLDMPAAD